MRRRPRQELPRNPKGFNTLWDLHRNRLIPRTDSPTVGRFRSCVPPALSEAPAPKASRQQSHGTSRTRPLLIIRDYYYCIKSSGTLLRESSEWFRACSVTHYASKHKQQAYVLNQATSTRSYRQQMRPQHGQVEIGSVGHGAAGCGSISPLVCISPWSATNRHRSRLLFVSF